jgi:hypothetical protein
LPTRCPARASCFLRSRRELGSDQNRCAVGKTPSRSVRIVAGLGSHASVKAQMNDFESAKPKGDYRSAAAAYGAVLGGVMCLLLFALPFPLGLVILCGGLCVQLTCFAVVVWWRTRLPLFSAVALIGAIGCGVQIDVALHAFRVGVVPQGFADMRHFWPMAAIAPLVALCMLVEPWWHRDRCEPLKAAMEGCTVTDMLLFRHIPNLRRGPTAVEHGRDGAT